MADISRQTTSATANLKRLGVSPAGARQVLSGQAVTNQADRDLIARILGVDHAEASKPVSQYNLFNAWPTKT